MSELTRRAHELIDEPLRTRATREALEARTIRRRRVRQSSIAGLTLLLLLGVGTPVALWARGGSTTTITTFPPQTMLASYFQSATSVPDVTLDAVGLPGEVAVPSKMNGTTSPRTSMVTVSYIGAEYCPYCALQRWALVVALSKFGTFTHLDQRVFSSSSDVFPHLASWSFINAGYSSTAIRFTPVELTSTAVDAHGQYVPLGRASITQRRAMRKWDRSGEIPFVDVGGAYYTLGASASPAVLEGLSVQQIGSSLADPSSPVAAAIDGTANYLIAAICEVDGRSSPAICSSPTIARAQEVLSTGVPPRTPGVSPSGAPVQPPYNAPMGVWRQWSNEMHAFDVKAAASILHSHRGGPGCSVTKVSVTRNVLHKTVLGIPAGVTLWAISVTGHCPPHTGQTPSSRS
ncbi:MAG: DUF929 family protein [Acidimicrobiales bacterium]